MFFGCDNMFIVHLLGMWLSLIIASKVIDKARDTFNGIQLVPLEVWRLCIVLY